MKKSQALFFLFLSCFLFGQKEPNLSKFKTQKEKLQAWAEYCDKFLGVEDYKTLKIVAKKGLLLTSKNDYYNQSLFNFYIGISFNFKNETDSISSYLEKSERLARLAKNDRRVAEALRSMLVCYRNYGSTSKRERVLNELHKVVDTSKDDAYKSKILSEISDYYINIGQYEKGLQYKLDGLYSRKKHLPKGNYNDTINYGVQLVNISELYFTMENLPKSLEYLTESEPYLAKYKEGVAAVHNDFISIYLKQNNLQKAEERYFKFESFLKTVNLDDCFEYLIQSNLLFSDYYLKNKQYTKALSYVNYANNYVEKYASVFTKAQVNQMFGKIYLKQKEYQKALPFLQLAEPILKEDTPEANSALQKLLSETYDGIGNTKLAYLYLNNYVKLQESLLAEKAKKNLAEMEAKYQNNAKKQELKTKNLQISNAKRQRWFLLSGLAFLAIVGLLLFYQNRTRKKANQKLQLLNQELDQANKIKARFFSILNHDLRSPVSNLIHFLHLQNDNPELLNEETQKRMQDKTISGAEDLLVAMEDILLWSKGQMENFKPQPTTVSIKKLFTDTQKIFSGYEKIQFNYLNPEKIELVVDENYLNTIVRNLTNNAIKALDKTQNPTITWTARTDNGKTILSITDNGPGAGLEKFKALYDDQEVVGIKTGLGLHLIRDLAKAIDCHITIDSQINMGTTFTLEL